MPMIRLQNLGNGHCTIETISRLLYIVFEISKPVALPALEAPHFNGRWNEDYLQSQDPVPGTQEANLILLISPNNQVLLLHRVQTSSSFPSAHVFPGGNLSADQDGDIPEPEGALRHEDSDVYRMGAIRECFEESGILLAKRSDAPHHSLELTDDEREEGRHAIHNNSVRFQTWLEQKGGKPDLDRLIPFTRWVTPINIPKRFTTQMYLYFLPLSESSSATQAGSLLTQSDATIPVPTSDGGIEHTMARFLPASKWLSMSRTGEIILFPPQYFLLHLLSPFLTGGEQSDDSAFLKQRTSLMDFVKSGSPPWTDKCISPTSLMWKQTDGRVVLGLDKPGPELANSQRKGDVDRVVLVDFRKEGPRRVEVAWRTDVFKDERQSFEKLYVPRKCSATNRIIKAKDHASVQISVGKVDENGRYTGENQVYALCGFVRSMGESDDSLNRLAQRDGLLKSVWSGSSQR
ncbi:hypothetical protein MMC06_000968 [Schaereria dolodes]|nr:hypothetical protein [Schaereria dolodes]